MVGEPVEDRLRDGPSGPTRLALDVRIDQDGVRGDSQRLGPIEVGHHPVHRGRVGQPEGPDDPEGDPRGDLSKLDEILGRLFAMELDQVESDSLRDLADLPGGSVHEKAHRLGPALDRRRDPPSLVDGDQSGRSRVEIEADPVGPSLGASQGIDHISQPANFDFDPIQI